MDKSNTMENFFVENKFYTDLDDYLEDIEFDEETINELSDDWTEDIYECELEKIFTLEKKDIVSILYDSNEDRFPEDSDSVDSKIEEAIKQSIDFEKLNNLLPSLYYPTGKKIQITKKDLIKWIKA